MGIEHPPPPKSKVTRRIFWKLPRSAYHCATATGFPNSKSYFRGLQSTGCIALQLEVSTNDRQLRLEAVAQLGLSTISRASHTWVSCPTRARGSVTADSAPDMRPPHEPEASFHPPSLEVSLISSQPVAGLKVQYNANIVKDAEEADIPNTPSARV
ncbi:hypothetical protein ABHI18_002822 [Aspergillus niger]